MKIRLVGYRLSAIVVGIVAVVSARPAQAQADRRDAAKKILRAIVTVEWRAEEAADAQGSNDKNPDGTSAIQVVPPGQVPASSVAKYLVDPATGRATTVTAPMTALGRNPNSLIVSTGTIVSPDGLIATFDSGERSGTYLVTYERKSYPAKIVVRDHRTGLILLKIDANQLPAMTVSATTCEPGESVIAGFAFRSQQPVITAGMVSGTENTSAGFGCELIPVDLRVAPGAAGGPVTDTKGELVGLLVASLQRNPDDQTLMVPVRYVQMMLNSRRGEELVVIYRGYLGVALEPDQETHSAKVQRALDGSPAASAGILLGDKIKSVDGKPIHSPHDVIAAVGQHQAGDTIAITIQRDNDEKKFDVKLERSEVKQVLPDQNGIPSATIREWAILPPQGDAANYISLYEQARTVYEQALKSGKKPTLWTAPAVPAPNVIQVERSDVDKKLDALSADIRAIRDAIDELAKQVKESKGK